MNKYKLKFKNQFKKDLKKINRLDQERIIKKLEFFIAQKNPLSFASALRDHKLGEYRFRVGDYRVIFDLENENLIVLRVGHRREIYQ